MRVEQSAPVLSLVLAITILRASGNTDIGTARWESDKSRDLLLFTFGHIYFVISLTTLRRVGNNLRKLLSAYYTFLKFPHFIFPERSHLSQGSQWKGSDCHRGGSWLQCYQWPRVSGGGYNQLPATRRGEKRTYFHSILLGFNLQKQRITNGLRKPLRTWEIGRTGDKNSYFHISI